MHVELEGTAEELLARIGSRSLMFGSDQETVALRRELRDMGAEAARLLMDQIWQILNISPSLDDEEEKMPDPEYVASLYNKLSLLYICAQPIHFGQITSITRDLQESYLYWTEVAQDLSGSFRLIDIMGRTVSSPEYLIDFMRCAERQRAKSGADVVYILRRMYLSIFSAAKRLGVGEDWLLETLKHILGGYRYGRDKVLIENALKEADADMAADQYNSLFEVKDDDLAKPHSEDTEDSLLATYAQERRLMAAGERIQTLVRLHEVIPPHKEIN